MFNNVIVRAIIGAICIVLIVFVFRKAKTKTNNNYVDKTTKNHKRWYKW